MGCKKYKAILSGLFYFPEQEPTSSVDYLNYVNWFEGLDADFRR